MVESDVIEAEPLQDADVLDLVEVERFMSRVFNPNHRARQQTPSSVVVQAKADTQPAADYDDFDSLVSKASKAIEILATRCEIMEHDLTEAANRMAEQEQTANRWKNLALELRSQATEDQAMIEELRTRLEEAEAHIASLAASADEARERVADADARSSRLHHQVIAAFGRRSPVHSVLQAVTFQEAAE